MKSENWYVTAFSNEFVGPDATLQGGDHIRMPYQDALEGKGAGGGVMVPGFESPLKDPTSNQTRPSGENIPDDVPIDCPICKSKIHEFEVLGYKNDKGETVYKCNNCHYTNDRWNIKVTNRDKKRPKSRVNRKRRASSDEKTYIVAATPAVPYNNPAATPYGRWDFSEDIRVVPWDRVHEDFEDTYDFHKQKKDVNYKIKKVKDKNGNTKFVKVRDKSQDSGVQPSNTYLQKGKIKNQPRYNPKTENVSKSKKNPGSWPHNRNGDPSDAWYDGADDERGNDSIRSFDADMRERVTPWDEYIRDRDSFLLTLTKPI